MMEGGGFILYIQHSVTVHGSAAALQSRPSDRLFLQSSELGLPHPLIRRRMPSPPLVQEGGTLAWEGRGIWGGGPISDEGAYIVVL